MPRHATPLECSPEDKTVLAAMLKSRTEDARVVKRARIILARLGGRELRQVALDMKVSVPTVAKWCKRFSLLGLKGLRDDPRPGKPAKYDAVFRDRVLALLAQIPPQEMSRWDGPALAERLGSSVYAVWRVLRREGVYLRRRRSWRIHTETPFVPRTADVLGLYLNPPLNALLLRMSEAPNSHAGGRTSSGYVETDSGAVARALLREARRRQGPLTLLAALEAGPGPLRTEITEGQKREDFQHFLNRAIADLPPGHRIHAILNHPFRDKKNRDRMMRQEDGRIGFYLAPSSAHWLGLVEVIFGMLLRKTGEGEGVRQAVQLRAAIESFARAHDENGKPLHWRKAKPIAAGPEIQS